MVVKLSKFPLEVSCREISLFSKYHETHIETHIVLTTSMLVFPTFCFASRRCCFTNISFLRYCLCYSYAKHLTHLHFHSSCCWLSIYQFVRNTTKHHELHENCLILDNSTPGTNFFLPLTYIECF